MLVGWKKREKEWETKRIHGHAMTWSVLLLASKVGQKERAKIFCMSIREKDSAGHKV
jgi:hypothetical protein